MPESDLGTALRITIQKEASLLAGGLVYLCRSYGGISIKFRLFHVFASVSAYFKSNHTLFVTDTFYSVIRSHSVLLSNHSKGKFSHLHQTSFKGILRVSDITCVPKITKCLPIVGKKKPVSSPQCDLPTVWGICLTLLQWWKVTITFTQVLNLTLIVR